MVEPHGKPRWRRRPWEIELLEALYADAMVCGVLDRHGVPIAPLSGPAWQRSGRVLEQAKLPADRCC